MDPVSALYVGISGVKALRALGGMMFGKEKRYHRLIDQEREVIEYLTKELCCIRAFGASSEVQREVERNLFYGYRRMLPYLRVLFEEQLAYRAGAQLRDEVLDRIFSCFEALLLFATHVSELQLKAFYAGILCEFVQRFEERQISRISTKKKTDKWAKQQAEELSELMKPVNKRLIELLSNHRLVPLETRSRYKYRATRESDGTWTFAKTGNFVVIAEHVTRIVRRVDEATAIVDAEGYVDPDVIESLGDGAPIDVFDAAELT
jgi:hypothetical protein